MSDGNSSASAYSSVLSKQEATLAKLSAKYLAVEEAYFDLTENVNLDALDTDQRSAHSLKLSQLKKGREELMSRIRDVRNRVETTRSLIDLSGNQAKPIHNHSYVRIPPLPSFRGEDKNSIKDAYEFLDKVKSLFIALELPEERWFKALLTTMTSYDRQWAATNLTDLNWTQLERSFLNHFESPALRDKLIHDLMTIKMKQKESVQEYSDRFTSLMCRTNKRDDDETLVAVYIDGLDYKLQELMNVSRASALTMWSRLRDGTPPVSIAAEIANAITLDAARNTRKAETANKTDKQQDSTGIKRCAKCKSRWHTTEEHRSKPNSGGSGAASSSKQPATTSSSDESKEKKCFKCSKPWKPGHKCSTDKKQQQNNNIQFLHQPNAPSDVAINEPAVGDSFAATLAESILNATEDVTDVAALNTISIASDGQGDASTPGLPYASNVNLAPIDASDLIYTPVLINDHPAWALVDSGATTLFISSNFVKKHSIGTTMTRGTIVDGRGKTMAARRGKAYITVMNGDYTVPSSAEVMDMPPGRDLVIGLDHFQQFGYELRGVPALPPHSSTQVTAEEDLPALTEDEDGPTDFAMTAEELSPRVAAVVETNQQLTESSYCTHPLATLPLKPSDTSPIWRRLNFVSKKDADAVNATVSRWLRINVIERAPQDCLNCFPLLAVPKRDNDGIKKGVRPFLDVRLLNSRLPPDNYELPRIQDILDQVASALAREVRYTTLDIQEGVFRFVIPPEDRN